MALLFGAGDLGAILQQIAQKPMTDYPSEAAAQDAPMPTLLAGQKAILVTVTQNGKTTTHQKTADGLTTWIEQ